jgi:hypothetical protein
VKKAPVFFVLLLLANAAAAQTLNTLFLQLPDSCLLAAKESWYKPLDAAGRAALLKDKKFDTYTLTAFDPKNGYLAFSTATDGPGYEVEMTFWKLKSGARLVGLNVVASGLLFSYTKRVRWLQYEQGKWKDVSKNHLPSLQIADFYAPGQAPKTAETKAMRWYFRLPQQGVNIEVHAPDADDRTAGGPPAFFYELQWREEAFKAVRKEYEK